MISRKANIGCGPVIKEGWTNIDSVFLDHRGNLDFRLYDVTSDEFANDFNEKFEFVLVNHVLCTMNDWLAHKALINIHRSLKPGGMLQVIDMDLLKVFQSYQDGRIEDLPIEVGSLDDKLCEAISGYGTRDSLYTPRRMARVLESAGFRVVKQLGESEHDTRPKESMVFEAIK